MIITDVLAKIQDLLSDEEYNILNEYFSHLLYTCPKDHVQMLLGEYTKERTRLIGKYDNLRQALVELLDDY